GSVCRRRARRPSGADRQPQAAFQCLHGVGCCESADVMTWMQQWQSVMSQSCRASCPRKVNEGHSTVSTCCLPGFELSAKTQRLVGGDALKQGCARVSAAR
ncbi:MAG: hypothetical protein ACK559_22365, partial [bacterium]